MEIVALVSRLLVDGIVTQVSETLSGTALRVEPFNLCGSCNSVEFVEQSWEIRKRNVALLSVASKSHPQYAKAKQPMHSLHFFNSEDNKEKLMLVLQK